MVRSEERRMEGGGEGEKGRGGEWGGGKRERERNVFPA